MKYYTNDRYPKEKVYEDEKLEWLKEHAGITFKDFSTFDIESKSIQEELKEEMVDWFFSDWIESEEEVQEEDGQAVIDDLGYLDEVDRRRGLWIYFKK